MKYQRIKIENTSDIIVRSKRPTGLKTKGKLLQDFRTGYYWLETSK